MAVLESHIRWYEEIFSLPGFLSEPVLLFGFQEIWLDPKPSKKAFPVPPEYRVGDLVEFLKNRGIGRVEVVDHFDPRADFRQDMNQPVPEARHGQYGTLIDIGSLEHVFDTRQCFENCLRLVRPGGTYLLHTAVKGYYRHGLHTFNPEGLLQGLILNGFEILYHRYSSARGEPLDDPGQGGEVLIWLVARKVADVGAFTCPQQGGWKSAYEDGEVSDSLGFVPIRRHAGGQGPTSLQIAREAVRAITPPIMASLYRRIRSSLRRRRSTPAQR